MLSVSVTGLVGVPAQLGSAVAIRSDGGGAPTLISLTLNAGALTGNAVVAQGIYTVALTPPAGHNVTSPNPVVDVAVGVAPASAQFTVAEMAADTGTIRVLISGLTGASAGGSASARLSNNTGPTFPGTCSVPAAGVSGVDLVGLPAGVYNVTYSPPAGFQRTGGATAPVQVTVASGGTTDANFTAEPIPVNTGNIRVNVSGLTGATAGGSASARLANNTGSTFAGTCSVPVSGNSNVDLIGLPVGLYNVTYTPPPGFRRAGGASAPVQVTVVSTGTVNANFTAETIPVGGSLLMVSNWTGTPLGTSAASRSDGGKWNLLGGTGQECVSAAGLDFPSPQVCKFVANRSNSGFALNRTDRLPPLAVGSTRYYRWYVRMTFPDPLVGNGDHPWQDGNAVSDCNWFAGVHYSTGTNGNANRPGEWQLTVYTLPPGASNAFNNGPWLAKNQTYRIECALERISTTQYNFNMRVYDSAGAMIADSDDFPADFGGGTVGSRGPYTFKNVANLNGFNCGTNDFETAGNDWWTNTFDYSYQGCFAIRDDGGWIGPYGSVAGET